MKVVYGKDDVAGKNMSYFLEKNFAVDVIALDEHPIYHDYPEKEATAKKGELIINPEPTQEPQEYQESYRPCRWKLRY